MALDTSKRVEFGLEMEERLQREIEVAIGCSLKKTACKYDRIDFEGVDAAGKRVVVELKSRRKYDKEGNLQYHTRYYSWLFPTHKEVALKNADRAYIFYAWVADGTLWVLEYNEATFQEYDRDVPEWHPQYQEHWYIPKTEWKLVVSGRDD